MRNGRLIRGVLQKNGIHSGQEFRGELSSFKGMVFRVRVFMCGMVVFMVLWCNGMAFKARIPWGMVVFSGCFVQELVLE